MMSAATSSEIVITGGTVVPMVRNHEWLEGDVALSGGRIDAVGSAGARSDDTVTLDARGAAVLPGFIQGHVHVVQSLLRHQADGLELLDWLRLRTWPYEAALDGDGVETAAELGIAELLCGGTTTALDFGTTHDHGRVFEAARRLGIRLVSGKTHMDTGDEVPAALLEDPERSLAEAEELGTTMERRGRRAAALRRGATFRAVVLGGTSGWMRRTRTQTRLVVADARL